MIELELADRPIVLRPFDACQFRQEINFCILGPRHLLYCVVVKPCRQSLNLRKVFLKHGLFSLEAAIDLPND